MYQKKLKNEDIASFTWKFIKTDKIYSKLRQYLLTIFFVIFLSGLLNFEFVFWAPGPRRLLIASSGPPPGPLRSHAYHVKRKGILPNTTRATYNAAVSRTTKVCLTQTQARYPPVTRYQGAPKPHPSAPPGP